MSAEAAEPAPPVAALRGFPAYAGLARTDPVTVYREPRGSVLTTLPRANPETATPYVFGIVGARAGWFDVLLPIRPNGASGWVPAAEVQPMGVVHRIVVHLHARSVELYDRDRRVASWPAGVGTTSNPTPTGHFYVLELLASNDPHGTYGPFALGMSGYSDTISEFNGGDGRWGIHGTDQPGLIPGQISHGCVRLRNSDVAALAAGIELGDPVDVVP